MSYDDTIRYFITFKKAIEEEKRLGTIITLFDEHLVKIILKKDGTYKIEPILYLHGMDAKDPKTYDNTVTSQKGTLAYELTIKELDLFNQEDILTFIKYGKVFNEYKDISFTKSAPLISYNNKNLK